MKITLTQEQLRSQLPEFPNYQRGELLTITGEPVPPPEYDSLLSEHPKVAEVLTRVEWKMFRVLVTQDIAYQSDLAPFVRSPLYQMPNTIATHIANMRKAFVEHDIPYTIHVVTGHIEKGAYKMEAL